jgi:hypothetical protein
MAARKKAKGDDALPPPPESDIQKACLEYLRLLGRSVWRFNSGARIVPATPDGGKRRFVRFSSAKGCSDLIGLLPASADGLHTAGRMLACECKRPGNKPTALQSAWLEEVASQGGLAICVCSVDDLRSQLRSAGYDAP